VAFSSSRQSLAGAFMLSSPLLRPEGKTPQSVAKRNFFDRKKEENPVENVQIMPKSLQSATEIRRQALLLWDCVIDLQDEIATLLSLIENGRPAPNPAEKARIYRPGQPPEQVDLVDLAREVLCNE
jgi:hypothetical protein